MNKLKLLELFGGIGACSKALERLGKIMNEEEYIYSYEELLDLVIKYQNKNKQLKEKIDKAIELIEIKSIRFVNENDYKLNSMDLREIGKILKGDSNE